MTGSAAPPPSSPRDPRSRRRARLAQVVAAVGLVVGASLGSAAPAAATSGVAWPVQSLGDRGTDVVALQRLVRFRLSAAAAADPTASAPAMPPADGLFRPTTADALHAAQATLGLPATGVADAITWTRLAPTIALGASGEAVLALQVELVAKVHASVVVDGAFGASTSAAVTAFQRHIGLGQTGIVDGATWRALVWHYQDPRFSSFQLCDYSVGNGRANWGTGLAISILDSVGRAMVRAGFGRVAVGDVSLEHGGNIAGHVTHERGLDIDVRPMRRANDQCSRRTLWTYTTYDRRATRAMIRAFRSIAAGHVKVIYFNDPVLIREGLTRRYPGHDDHVHIRLCETVHADAAYDC